MAVAKVTLCPGAFILMALGFAALGACQNEGSTAPEIPTSAAVSIPPGTGVPGCETTGTCFLPDSVTIKAGGVITWNNNDAAAHTVTHGTPADGPGAEFDSSLLTASALFQHTFTDAGTFRYFCLVHPWQEGVVVVVP